MVANCFMVDPPQRVIAETPEGAIGGVTQEPPEGAIVEREQQDPQEHDLQAEAEPPEVVKPTWQCGTPGCDLVNFHHGPHTRQQVVGPRQRRRSVRAHAAAETSEGPAIARVPGKSARKKRAAPPSEDLETHAALPEDPAVARTAAGMIGSQGADPPNNDGWVASPEPPWDPRRTDFLVRLFAFG